VCLTEPVTGNDNPTRRQVLRTGGALGVASLGLPVTGAAAANPATGDESSNGTAFGRVRADGV